MIAAKNPWLDQPQPEALVPEIPVDFDEDDTEACLRFAGSLS